MASVLGFFLTQITFLIAIPDITPMDCSIVSAISPILTMFIAAFALKEPITLRKAGGVAISFVGIILLILNSVSVSDSSRQTTLMGILLIIANCLSFSLYLGIFKPLIARYPVVTFIPSLCRSRDSHPRLCLPLRHLPLRTGLPHHLRHLRHLLPHPCRSEAHPPNTGEHVLLRATHHRHHHQHLSRHGHPRLAKGACRSHGLRRCPHGELQP